MQNVLVTGGSAGIGLALASRLLARGAAVLVTGRNEERLAAAARQHPGLLTFVSDTSVPAERERLAAHVRSALPDLDAVIQNAGIQRRIALAADDAPWPERQVEIDTLFAGPVHLNALLVPILLAHGRPSTIVNVTSGGAFVPQPFAPVYSACKAALHSYTTNLRFALAGTRCRVVELIPPAVQTSLASHGAPLHAFADDVFAALVRGDADEIGYGPTATPAFTDERAAARARFEQLALRFPVKRHA